MHSVQDDDLRAPDVAVEWNLAFRRYMYRHSRKNLLVSTGFFMVGSIAWLSIPPKEPPSLWAPISVAVVLAALIGLIDALFCKLGDVLDRRQENVAALRRSVSRAAADRDVPMWGTPSRMRAAAASEPSLSLSDMFPRRGEILRTTPHASCPSARVFTVVEENVIRSRDFDMLLVSSILRNRLFHSEQAPQDAAKDALKEYLRAMQGRFDRRVYVHECLVAAFFSLYLIPSTMAYVSLHEDCLRWRSEFETMEEAARFCGGYLFPVSIFLQYVVLPLLPVRWRVVGVQLALIPLCVLVPWAFAPHRGPTFPFLLQAVLQVALAALSIALAYVLEKSYHSHFRSYISRRVSSVLHRVYSNEMQRRLYPVARGEEGREDGVLRKATIGVITIVDYFRWKTAKVAAFADVELLNSYVDLIDDIILEKHRLQKIRVSGEQYIFTHNHTWGGESSANAVIEACYEIIKELSSFEHPDISFAAGVHTGQSVWGHVGRRMALEGFGDAFFACDIARYAPKGRIAISSATKALCPSIETVVMQHRADVFVVEAFTRSGVISPADLQRQSSLETDADTVGGTQPELIPGFATSPEVTCVHNSLPFHVAVPLVYGACATTDTAMSSSTIFEKEVRQLKELHAVCGRYFNLKYRNDEVEQMYVEYIWRTERRRSIILTIAFLCYVVVVGGGCFEKDVFPLATFVLSALSLLVALVRLFMLCRAARCAFAWYFTIAQVAFISCGIAAGVPDSLLTTSVLHALVFLVPYVTMVSAHYRWPWIVAMHIVGVDVPLVVAMVRFDPSQWFPYVIVLMVGLLCAYGSFVHETLHRRYFQWERAALIHTNAACEELESLNLVMKEMYPSRASEYIVYSAFQTLLVPAQRCYFCEEFRVLMVLCARIPPAPTSMNAEDLHEHYRRVAHVLREVESILGDHTALHRIATMGDVIEVVGPLVSEMWRLESQDVTLRAAARALLRVAMHPFFTSVVVNSDEAFGLVLGEFKSVYDASGPAVLRARAIFREAPKGYRGATSQFVELYANLFKRTLETGKSGPWAVRGCGVVRMTSLSDFSEMGP